MQKSGIILAGAVCFDLGIMVVSSQAAHDIFLKIEPVNAETVAACVNNAGAVVEKDGQKFCKTTKPDAPATTKPQVPANK